MEQPGGRQLVVLDRDGVINRDSDLYIKSPAEWRSFPASIAAIAQLTNTGFDVVVATNQSGIGRGLFSVDTLEAIHAKMTRAIEAAGGRLAGIYFCPHRPEQRCVCRKPMPGLLRQIESDLGRNLRGAPVVGDKLSDLEAAVAVGARPMLVRSGRGRETLAALGQHDYEVFDDLAAVAQQLIAEKHAREL